MTLCDGVSTSHSSFNLVCCSWSIYPVSSTRQHPAVAKFRAPIENCTKRMKVMQCKTVTYIWINEHFHEQFFKGRAWDRASSQNKYNKRLINITEEEFIFLISWRDRRSNKNYVCSVEMLVIIVSSSFVVLQSKMLLMFCICICFFVFSFCFYKYQFDEANTIHTR